MFLSPANCGSFLSDAKMRIMELAEDTKRVCEERDKLKGELAEYTK